MNMCIRLPAEQALRECGLVPLGEYGLVTLRENVPGTLFVFLPGLAVANSYILSGVSNLEPSALHVQEMLLFTQRFGEELLLVMDRLLFSAKLRDEEIQFILRLSCIVPGPRRLGQHL